MTPAGRRRVRPELLAGVGVVLLGVAFWALAAPGETGSWAEVERADLVIGVPVSGVLEATRTDRLGPPAIPQTWNFRISYLVPEGTEVEQGTPVVGFDTSELEQDLQQKLAEQEQSAKEIEKLVTSLEIRRRDLELQVAEAEGRHRLAVLKLDVPPDAVAVRDAQVAELDLQLSERELEFQRRQLALLEQERRTALAALREKRGRAVARVAEIRDQIERMTVTAPSAGTVIYASQHNEEKSKVGDSVWRGATVVEIPDLAGIRAAGELEELAAGRVAVGQAVALRLDAHPDITYTGRVTAIERAVRRRSRSDPTKVFRLTIELDAADPERMRPGMRFQGAIEVERVPQTLVVPAQAVFGSPEGPTVFRRGLGGVRAVRPRLGRRSLEQVEVLEGLAAGDRVALERPTGEAE